MTLLERVSAVLAPSPSIVPLTVDQYHQMISAGVLPEGAPIELIDGLLVRKDRSDLGEDPMSHGKRHSLSVKRLNRLMRPVEESGFHLHSQLPVTIRDFQEPEPDLAVVRGVETDYADNHPGPSDIAAIMEVAASSLASDRKTKLRIYAVAGIPIYWIVNLVENQIEVYEQPEGLTYANRIDYGLDATLSLVLPGLTVAVKVADVIPV